MNSESLNENAKLLEEAIISENVEAVRDLISKNPELCRRTNSENGDEFSPLRLAILQESKKIVELLIKFGANVNEVLPEDESGHSEILTFFHVIAMKKDSPIMLEIAEILINHGADVNASCSNAQRPPIDLAIQVGNMKCVELFLRHGARLAGPEWKEHSPMQTILCAPTDKQKEILLLLVKHGFDSEYRDHNGQNLLHLFINRFEESHPDDLEIIKILLDAGVSLDELDDNGYSPLCYSIILKKTNMVSYLLDKGADVNQRCNLGGDFPLSLAAMVNHLDVIKLLLSHGVDVNAKTQSGKTALHIACFYNREDIIRELVRKGAVVSLTDKDGNTPFSLLKREESHYDDCVITMVKEFSKLSFERVILCKKDEQLIRANRKAQQLYITCQKELTCMKRVKFYDCNSYYDVLNTAKMSVRKLANLTKNKEFVKEFKKKLNFCHYKNDLLRIFDEAVELRDKTFIVESRLYFIFGNFFSDLVIEKLAENLMIEDLPLELELLSA